MSPHFLYPFVTLLFVYGWLSVNIYLPILPQLESIFRTTHQTAKLTVSVFLIGFSTAQLVWGPLSDRFGRRPVLLTGIAISAIGAALAGFATNISLFIGARFLESLGMGVGPVLARSVLTDTLDKAHVAIAMAYAAIVVAVVPALAPILGGYLDLLLSWRAIFFFLALFGAGVWWLSGFRLHETNKGKVSSLKVYGAVRNYIDMINDGRYFGYILIYCIAFGSLVGYYAMSPFIFINILGFDSHDYGHLLLLNVLFYVVGASVSRFAVPKLGTDRPLLLAVLVYALSAVIFVVLEFYTTMNTMSVLVPMSIFIFGCGMVSPAANTGAMTIFKERVGASTAILGFAIAMGGAIFTGGLAHVHISRLWELAAYVIVSTLISIATYLVFLRKRSAGA